MTDDTTAAALAEQQAIEEAARRRAHGLADAEQQLRRRLARELAAELRRPLIEHHGPSDIEAIAAQRKPRPAR